MNELKIFAVPIGVANPYDEEDFITKAKEYGYVWNIGELPKAMNEKKIDLHGLMLKTIIV